MNILIVASPLTGHLNPLLGVGRILIDAGHQVTCLSGSHLGGRATAIGADFRSFSAAADLNQRQPALVAGELKELPPGVKRLRLAIERRFIETIPAQQDDIMRVLQEVPADIIIADSMMFGLLTMLMKPRSERLPIVLCGTSFLHWQRQDGAPHFVGLPPPTAANERESYARIAAEYDRQFNKPIADALVRAGVRELPNGLFDSVVELPDAYLQLTVPGFEFPRPVPNAVHFVGRLPIIPNQAPLPPWAGDLDGRRKVVLVTQGTVANDNLGLLIRPTLQALEGESDLLVLVTMGGRSIDELRIAVPSNARVAEYLPFEWVLPKIAVFVTNGGYGSVNQALSFGVPLVTAGLTEDKADVNARVAWSGAGIDLRTNSPTPEAIRTAVRTTLDTPGYRLRASGLAADFSRTDARSEIVRIVKDVVHAADTGTSDR
ncbi:glycosyltransferase [Rhizobium sp. BE258]|uniref:glycosyltransferase n=1 Tax=Rhizobium sp. BE258 TaxID=2817722 RepID=UPI0028549320|nr:glycosyltransferase [Rhizobium sp. BE258]MDR7147766.1 MGT family glycosyltransferase [Rhizobium sp. BE258]